MELWNSMDKRFWAIIGVLVVIFGGILVFNNHKKGDSSTTSTQPTNHVEGKLDSKVTLVEYGDYQCPACESFYTTVQTVQQKYNDSVKFQFRNLPLSSLHPNAIAGARAAEAADMQGKFWQMHDLLYTQQNYYEWAYNTSAGTVTSTDPMPYFTQYAQQLGLNVTKFKSDFSSAAVNNRIQADIAAFNKTGQSQSTPSFFLNGKYVNNSTLLGSDGQPNADNFSKVIDTALKSAK
jgi:protein-disulfide isomerase